MESSNKWFVSPQTVGIKCYDNNFIDGVKYSLLAM